MDIIKFKICNKEKGEFMKSGHLGKTMKVIYVIAMVLALFVISDGKKQIAILEQNPIIKEFNNTVDNNYKIKKFNDTTSTVELERGLISQEYTIIVKKEINEKDYINVSNQLLNFIENKYSKNNIGSITINFVKKKGNILLYTTIYLSKK